MALSRHADSHGNPLVNAGAIATTSLISGQTADEKWNKVLSFYSKVAAADGNAVLDLIRRYAPDLVILDLDMPGLNGIEVTRKLAESSKDPPVLICSIITDPDVVEAARQAGALAYVFKTRIEQDLILASTSVLQGKPFPLPASH